MAHDLFAGEDINEIPEDFNLEPGFYEEVAIDSIKTMKSKKDKLGIAINFKDVSEDGFGLTAFKWLSIPAETAQKAFYLKRDLVALGFTNDQLAEFNNAFQEEALDQCDAILCEVEDNIGTLQVKQNGEYTNVTFKLAEDDSSPVESVKQEPDTKVSDAADTSALEEWV